MFLTPSSFVAGFDPEVHLQPSERDIYAARAKIAKQRYVWSPALLPVFKNCLIHLSANVPGKVAYYASVPNMVANRLTRTSPEMFLSRSLCGAPGEIQAAWMTEVLGHVLPELHFIENNNPDGWYEIYNDGPGSCMAGSQRVRQYAHPKNNLALAYIVNKDDDITHRVIVNKARKTYLRIYGGEGTDYFVAALNKAGYTQSGDTLRDEYIHLAYHECDRCGRDTLVGPYLDGCWDLVECLDRRTGVIGDNGDSLNYSSEEIYCGCDEENNEDDDEY